MSLLEDPRYKNVSAKTQVNTFSLHIPTKTNAKPENGTYYGQMVGLFSMMVPVLSSLFGHDYLHVVIEFKLKTILV